MGIGEQLKDLILSAVPTVILLYVLYFFLKANLFGPLGKAMAERQARSEGARRDADAARSAAVGKMGAYQEAIQKARTQIYSEQDAARRAALEERAALIRETRAKMHLEVQAGKEAIAADVARARAEIEGLAPALAGEIVRTILEPRAGGAP